MDVAGPVAVVCAAVLTAASVVVALVGVVWALLPPRGDVEKGGER